MSSEYTPFKKRRITRACDRCHRGGIRCSVGTVPLVCGPCSAFGSECTYDRPMKRRGPPARSRRSDSDLVKSKSEPSPVFDDHEGWTYQDIASHEHIEALVRDYYTIAYPILPYFHWPTFTSKIRDRLYTQDPALHAVTMAVCAITSARVRDGARPCPFEPDHQSSSSSSKLDPPPTSETFYRASIASFPTDITRALDINFKRMKLLSCLLCVQYGDLASANGHIGDYLTICAVDGSFNESRWPPGLNEIEVQERRRLFWSGYQIEVYIATTWNGIVRHREAQSTVLYPAEVHCDEDITPEGILPPSQHHQSLSFLRGFNFVNDLYRILEHAVSDLRTRNQAFDKGNPIAALYSRNNFSRSNPAGGPSPDEVLGLVEKLYEALPKEFRGTKEPTGDMEQDRFGHQAANIIITLQTVKMVMAGMAEWSVEQRCTIAGELLDALSTVPALYIRASGATMIHHLAGVGHLLASIISSPISPSAYVHVRTVLLNMADLLATLEPQLKAAGAAPSIRKHVERIDRYMLSATEASVARGSSVNARGLNFAVSQAPNAYSFSASPPSLSSQMSNLVTSTSPSNSQIQVTTGYSDQPAAVMKSEYPVVPLDRPQGNSVESLTIAQLPDDVDTLSGRQNPNSYLMSVGDGQHQQAWTNDSNQYQLQLPDNLWADWPFIYGEYGSQEGAFEFLAPGTMGGGGGNASGAGTVPWQEPE
ncbi:hypothetical protein IAR55_000813 [Kwoniella newhampshirensis]|uniref:Zn(2)-C6 fungal-type domain-containing protein n=1 Tax=Kwoniella newhampshirensis TaxID=1651941 RepID=A0AAW0Z440_9TREE